MASLSFKTTEQIEEIVTLDKRTTIRVNLNDDLRPGNTVYILYDSTEVAHGRVSWIKRCKPHHVNELDLEHHKQYYTTEEMLSHLKTYYPHVDVKSNLAVVRFELMQIYDVALERIGVDSSVCPDHLRKSNQ